MSTIYSFKDLSMTILDPDVGPFLLAGEIGMGELVIEMAMERISHQVSSDGSVMITYRAGRNGTIDIQVQQTSALHQYLLNWANAKFSNADAGNVQTLASATLTARNVLDGTQHVCKGVTPSKIPTKTYGDQGGNLTWRLMVADSQQTTISPIPVVA